jgi:hypothetical protein
MAPLESCGNWVLGQLQKPSLTGQTGYWEKRWM